VWLKKVCWAEEPVDPGYAPTAIIDTLTHLPEIIGKL
jgi:hypothetical protein